MPPARLECYKPVCRQLLVNLFPSGWGRTAKFRPELSCRHVRLQGSCGQEIVSHLGKALAFPLVPELGLIVLCLELSKSFFDVRELIEPLARDKGMGVVRGWARRS